MRRLVIATSNIGKLRDFAAAARAYGIVVEGLRDFNALPAVVEDGATFEANARKKAEHCSRYASGELVLADDSGLEVQALNGAPGVQSARYAVLDAPVWHNNSDDAANNARLLQELASVPDGQRGARFVCVIAAARDGTTVITVRGEAAGTILRAPRGSGGFGYDPLFLVDGDARHRTMAELAPDEKNRISHRARALAAMALLLERQYETNGRRNT